MNESNLHPYQRTGIKHIIDKMHCALFLEMGLGKTVTTLTAANKLIYDYLEISRVLVIAPKRVAESVWAEECKRWEHLQHLKVSKVIGNIKQRKSALQSDADIYVIGRDNVSWLCGLYGGRMLPFDMCVIDELSSFKNPKSVRFRALRNVQPSFKRVVGLTGTPAPNGLIDLWSQIYLLDRGERLGKFITHYRDKYFRPTVRNGDVVYKYGLQHDADQIIHSKIKDICMSMKAKDYLDLPGLVENIVNIDFDKKIQKLYDDFEREQVLELFSDLKEGEVISAVNAAALSNKLLQFANGAVYDEKKNYHEVHNLKIEAVEEIIEEANGKPVLIAWTFRHDMYRLMEKLKKYKPRELKTNQDIDDWNDGKIQVMMMHPASGGHGLNLQSGGNNIVWFGQTWSLELLQQLNARLYRQGQKNVVIIHKLVCRNTMDESVVSAQVRKSKKQDSLMEAVKARINKHLFKK